MGEHVAETKAERFERVVPDSEIALEKSASEPPPPTLGALRDRRLGVLGGSGKTGLMSPAAPLFPVFLKLEGRKVLLVGGGAVAFAKLPELIRAGALVTIVAPQVRSEMTSFSVIVVQRRFVPSDLDDAWFVVAAAPADVNRQVAAAAEERRVFVNAVDDAARASAYTGGVFRRGGVTIAVSTEGRAPALAGLLREGLEALVPDDIEAWVVAARQLRQQQRGAGVPMANRRPLLLGALNRLYEAKRIEGSESKP